MRSIIRSMERIDVEEDLKNVPRPHYLRGFATYKEESGAWRLNATARFPSEQPSIADRAKAHTPHVNIADAYFGLWNAIHIIARRMGIYDTLANSGSFEAKRPIPPDQEIQLEVLVGNFSEQNGRIEAQFEGKYSLNG